MTEEEKKYKNTISALKSLPKVKAKDDFEQKLYRKLRDVDSEKMSPSIQRLTKPVEKNWIFNIFRPAFIPAVGITIALIAVIVIYINYMPKNDTTTISQNQQEQQKQELTITKPGSMEDKDLSANQEKSTPLSQDLSKTPDDERSDERSIEPVVPKSDIGTESPSIQPKETLSGPEIEQRIEKKSPVDEEKEMKSDRKTGDIKKNQNENLPEMKKTEGRTQDSKVNDGVLNGFIKSSRGLDKSKAKDSLKTDSIKSKKESGKDIDKNKSETDEKQNDTEKQAEPKQQEPEMENK